MWTPSPFVTAPTGLEPAWIDYNGHLNMAYYHVLFDRAVDDAMAAHGFNATYRAAAGASWFTVEAHIRYLAEVAPDARVVVSVRLAGFDDKRLHLAEELRDATTGRLHATSEQLLLHVGAAERRVVPFGPEAAAWLGAWAAADAALPSMDWLGRAVSSPTRGA